MLKPGLLLCTVVLGLVTSVGLSQPVPDTILLPDSLGPLRPGYHLAFGSSTNNIYVASESSDIIVVDGNTFQRMKRINTGTPIGGALLVSQHNKLYCSYPQQGRIAIIDCATNSVLGTIQVGTRPTSLIYSSGSDKLYCRDTIDCTVTAISCVTNEVLKVIPVGDSLTAVVYDPTTNKLYAATRDAVRAISCSSDSIVANIDEIRSSTALCVNKRRQELYVERVPWTAPDTVFVISTTTDSVVAGMTFVCSGGLEPALACNEVTDRLYAMGNSAIWEFDCSQDTFIRSGYAGEWVNEVKGMFCDTVRNRLFYLIAGYGVILLAWDCSQFELISRTGVGDDYSADFQADPARYRLMCAGVQSRSSTLAVFDYKGDSCYVRMAVPLSDGGRYLCRNPVMGKLYCPWAGGVSVIDEQTNRVVAQAFVSETFAAWGMAFSLTSNKLYFSSYPRGLGVMDGVRDSFRGFIETGWALLGPYPCWYPDGNRVYCFFHDVSGCYVGVVDCNTDSVVRLIDVVDDGILGFEYLGNDRMLSMRDEGLTLLDCKTDSIIADSATGHGDWCVAAHTGDGEKVYTVRYGHLEARSSNSLSLLDTIYWAPNGVNNSGDYLVYSGATNKLYWFSIGEHDSVLVIDSASDTVVARIGTSLQYRCACLDATGRYLFCAGSWRDNTLRVYDTRSDSLVAAYPHMPRASSIVSNPDQHCIYVGCQDMILVYPDVPPGVEDAAQSRTMKLAGPSLVSRNSRLVVYQPSVLLDAAGRKVMDLKTVVNDVRALAPGVYFVIEAQAQAQAGQEPQASSHKPQAIRKVVLVE
ncbi:hypothetical protein JXD38_04415 [candidate division WOR-3 bacterium]|nr:hypothetical protein [candidate division WOR-3 bacterium]